jgi:putative IMPACT (imprinted ancient) family translation regulator
MRGGLVFPAILTAQTMMGNPQEQRASQFTNVLIVVVRYFGGTLLGVPGLIHAYKSAAADCIHQGNIAEKHITEIYKLEFPYDAMPSVMKILKDFNLKQSNQKFELECELEFAVRKSEADHVTPALNAISAVKTKWLRTT